MKLTKWIVMGALAIGYNGVVLADDDNSYEELDCPASMATAMDTAYGAGTSDVTRCLQNRKRVRVVFQVNASCRDTAIVSDGAGGYKTKNHPTSCASNRAFALGNIKNMIKDYEAHGITNWEIAAVVHSGGGYLLFNDPVQNQFAGQVADLMAKGVRFYFCQNTVKSFIGSGRLQNPVTTGISVSDQLVEGTEFVTAGVTAIADFQSKGYSYVQP